MRIAYPKTHKTLSEQVELLQSRGLDCGSHEAAMQILHDYSYYTLSAYWYPFRRMLEKDEPRDTRWQHRASTFLPDAKLADAVAIADFDQKLRAVLFTGLAQLELSLRFQLAYVLGVRSPFAHTMQEHLDRKECCALPSKKFEEQYSNNLDHWLDLYDKQISRSKSEDFIQHFTAKYSSEVPIWMAVEVLDFGSLVRLFKLLKGADQTEISRRFGVSNGRVFHSVLYGLGILRNHVAHHNRVWNRRLSASLKHLPTGVVGDEVVHLQDIKDSDRNKLYPWVSMLAYMLKTYSPTTNWHRAFATQFQKFPPLSIINGYTQMAAPSGWRQFELWTSQPVKDGIITVK